ncbi:MAG TPA: CDP-glycerol glycerophosphotransferase family protein [Flexivirga sp.]|uniref:CDP-glycerol glycerophosphotransferase family protein n=1 Tax=Flexivirga sp. TaxID=1962927 RepID=UPI002C45074E|nr:CDP-glycerol glycerophosphotransferase family protein [Flexivirga sp.]HWC21445.1 CDP-glycerol glycerophosphotransferase family protein [Flexivirga sp.]
MNDQHRRPSSMIAMVARIARSGMSVWALVALAAATVALAVWPVAGWVIGVLVLAQQAALIVVGRHRPGPVLATIPLLTALSCVLSLRAHGGATVWVALTAGVAAAVCLAQEPLHQRVVPRVRAVNLPGVPSDPRAHEPGALTPVVPLAAALLALLLLADSGGDVPDVVSVLVLVLVLAAAAACAIRLRSAVRARRDGSVDREVTRALERYAPEFFVYFSGPVDGDYQVRMWLPQLEQLGVPFAILARNPEMLPRAARLTSAPLIACPRVTGLDACMVPSVRAVFYVNIHSECTDGIRYIDRTHVQLNHGDSDKPSSYHPMFAMFDQDFVAGRAAIDRFARHGVSVPEDKFVIVGRPQVAAATEHNIDPVPGRRTVLYAPTWQSGMREMSLSSMEYGEQIVRALLEGGARVVFRPHPLSRGQRRAAAIIARIDAQLEAAASSDSPHLTSSQALSEGIIDNFNRSDAMISDISSVASDYLASCKPLAVVLPTGAGQYPGADDYPVLEAAYLVDVRDDLADALRPVLDADADPLRSARRDLRAHYLGNERDSVRLFQAAARSVLNG